MGWNDERRERAFSMWKDGQSASQIARALGGVSRNAVIGVIHRAGIYRASPAKPARIVNPPRPARVLQPARPIIAMAPSVAPAMPAHVRAGGPMPPICYVEEGPGLATIHTLGAHMCKWPIGDPAEPGFTFCGRRSTEDGSYCHEHAQVAYQPAQAKKKSSAAELARSLRRYL